MILCIFLPVHSYTIYYGWLLLYGIAYCGFSLPCVLVRYGYSVETAFFIYFISDHKKSIEN